MYFKINVLYPAKPSHKSEITDKFAIIHKSEYRNHKSEHNKSFINRNTNENKYDFSGPL